MNKRTLLSISPEENKNSKKHLTCKNMDDNSKQDVFSWSKLCSLLDEKLKDVAKKDDIVAIKSEIEDLKEQNIHLKQEIKSLTNRIEQIDRRSRYTNVAVSGLTSSKTFEAKNTFMDVCEKVLNVQINIISARMVSKGKTFVFSLESISQVRNVLHAKNKLKGQKIFIQKDYTDDEQCIRYNLRQVRKTISNARKDITVRLGEFCIFINNKKFTWFKGKVVAPDESDADYLRTLLTNCGGNFDVIYNNRYNNNMDNAENTLQ